MEILGYKIVDSNAELQNCKLNFGEFVCLVFYTVTSWIGATDGSILSVWINLTWMFQIIFSNRKQYEKYRKTAGIAYHKQRVPWNVISWIGLFLSGVLVVVISFMRLQFSVEWRVCLALIGLFALIINLLNAVHTILADLFSECVDL